MHEFDRSLPARLLIVAVFFLICVSPGRSAPAEFHFTSIDEKLLDQANDLDAKIARKGLIYNDTVAGSWIEDIGSRLLEGSPPLERVSFRFHLIRDPMVNAFALPNGSIYVNTGLVAALRNEAQLASVLSHEITHVARRHAYLENRSIRKKNVAIDVLRGGTALGQTIWLAAETSQIFVVASVYGYSRELENDADRDGFRRLVQGSYDGNAMTAAFEILDEKIELEPVRPFWRTHPKLEERIAASKSMVLRNNTIHPREVGEGDYLEHMAPIIRYNIELDLESRRARTAVDRAQRLVDWRPEDPRNLTLLADAYRSLGAKTETPVPEELTRAGRRENRNRLLKRTAEEEQRELMTLADGQRTLRANDAKAESNYRKALRNAPRFAEAHRGLGMLYEQQSRESEAAAEYSDYLALAPPDAVDRLRIERRLEKLRPGMENR